MSCFNPCKKPPQPSRVWSRVQNTCSTNIASTTPNEIFFPLKNKILTIQQVTNEIQMIEKGNILQYKKNSSNITKQQRYAQIAKGQWVNRNPTLATQGQNMTDPNTRGLKRVNFKTIYADDGTDAFEPVTCPQPNIIPIPEKLPPRVGTRPGPPAPPPQPVDPNVGPNSMLDPNYPSLCPQYVDPADYLGNGPNLEISDTLPSLRINKWPAMVLPYIDPSEPEKPRDVIPDGGNFICGPDDMCPTTIKVGRNFYKSDHCNPTTASDVPGPVQDLCYNSRKLATFYPRQRRVMTNSGDKFPTGYKFDPELQIQAQECIDRNKPPAPEPETGPTFGPPVFLSLTSSPETISVTNTTSIYQQPTRSPNSSVFKVGDTVVYAYDDSILVVGTTDMFVLLDNNILTEYQITISDPPPTIGPPVFLSVTSSPETISVTSTSSIYQQTTRSPDSSVVKVGDTVVYGYDDSSLPVGTTDMFVLLDNNILTEYQITISDPPPTYGPPVYLTVTSSPKTISVTSTSSIYQQTTRSLSSNVEKVGNTIVYTYDDSVLVEGTTDMFVLLDDNILTEYQITIDEPELEPYDTLNEYTMNLYSSNEFKFAFGSDWPFSMVQAPVHGTIILVNSSGDVLSDNPATAPATTTVGLYYPKYVPNDPDNPNYAGGDYVIFRQVNPDNGKISESRLTINLIDDT